MLSLRCRTPLLVAFGSLCGCGSSELPMPPARNALLVTLDTTRWDAVDGFGYRSGVTPVLERLGREGVRFRWARTVAPITLPAHASILTGLYPPRHGVRANGFQALPEAATTLAERARDAGFETAAFVSAAVLAREFGLDQGFGVYDEPPVRASATFFRNTERTAPAASAAAIEWLRRRDPERRFLLWVHYFDPHRPFDAAPRFAREPEEEERPEEHAYLAEVAQMDAGLGELVAELEAQGVLDETLVAVVGDHGESLWEHGEESHAALCYDATLRVPLLLRWPARIPAGEERDGLASGVDLHPTLVAALGLAPTPDVDGRDLLAGSVPPERGVYFESYYGYLNFGWSPLAGWARRGAKYVHGARPVLFDPDADPFEVRPLPEDPDVVRGAREAIARVVERPRSSAATAGVDPELAQRIASLGYATAGQAAAELPHPLAPSELPDPALRIEELARLNRADALVQEGRPSAGIDVYEEILAENPRNAYAALVLAKALESVGRGPEAVRAFERRLELVPGDREAAGLLARLLERLGEHERARALRRDSGRD